MRPDTSVPVTTVPKPFTENTRSTGRRAAPSIAPRFELGPDGRQHVAQRVQPFTRFRRDRKHRCVFEERPGDEFAHLQPRQFDHLGIGGIGLREHDDPGRDLEQPADVEVLARLGHDRLVGGNHEHHQVDAACAGQHVPDEPLVPRHVDEGEIHVRPPRGAQTRGRW